MIAWDPILIETLRSWGADEHGHRLGSLLEHLAGTADRLRDWGHPLTVCHAGLFHSVYGTRSYSIQTVPLARRAEVAALIGPEAERLAFLFCVLDRRELRGCAVGEDVELHDHATGAPRPVRAAEVDQLLEIEVANLLDQIPPRAQASDEVRSYFEAFREAVSGRISAVAQNALDQWFE